MSRILVVDDLAAIRQVVRRALEREGHTLVECADGAQALPLLENTHFDLLITDINMPGLDGIQLTRALRKRPAAPKIIAMSGNGEGPSFEAARLLGAAETLTKPFTLDELTDVVKKVLPAGETNPG